MRPVRPQNQPRVERSSSRLKAFADLQVKLIIASMNRMLIARLKKKDQLSEVENALLTAVEKISLTPPQEQSLRRAEEAILQQIMAAKKGKLYLRSIASMRTHTPVSETAVTSDVTADQRRRAISLQLLHQFLLTEAVPQSQILPVRIEDPIDNPFLPTHRVEAFSLTIERWIKSFIYENRATRPPKNQAERTGSINTRMSAGPLPQSTVSAPVPASKNTAASDPTMQTTQATVAAQVALAPKHVTPVEEGSTPTLPASEGIAVTEEGKVTPAEDKSPSEKKAVSQANGKVTSAAAKKETSRRKP